LLDLYAQTPLPGPLHPENPSLAHDWHPWWNYGPCQSSEYLHQQGGCPDQAFSFQRILDCGAYVGFSAIYLSLLHPQAQILCVEPDPDNFVVLERNIWPYRNITAVRGAVSQYLGRGSLTRINQQGLKKGFWATRFLPDAPGAFLAGPGERQRDVSGPVPSESPFRPMGRPLEMYLDGEHWSDVDLVKLDIEGSEAEVLGDPQAGLWLSRTKALVLELHEDLRPGTTEIARGVLAHDFHIFPHQEGALYLRKTVWEE
jgi:FkbM family methyltransferase